MEDGKSKVRMHISRFHSDVILQQLPLLHTAKQMNMKACWHWMGLKTAPPTRLTRLEAKQDLAGSVNVCHVDQVSLGKTFMCKT